ncbi:MAG: hypothetical protein Q9M16_06780 [Mariprofundus sp.]|nr:hypothetical protein [Mariprofundus sp.]
MKPMIWKTVEWAEMTFPPINLWTLASLPPHDTQVMHGTAHVPQKLFRDTRYEAMTTMKRVQLQRILHMHGSTL